MEKNLQMDGHIIKHGSILGHPDIDYDTLTEEDFYKLCHEGYGRLKFGYLDDVDQWWVTLIDCNEYASYPIEQLADIPEFIMLN